MPGEEAPSGVSKGGMAVPTLLCPRLLPSLVGALPPLPLPFLSCPSLVLPPCPLPASLGLLLLLLCLSCVCSPPPESANLHTPTHKAQQTTEGRQEPKSQGHGSGAQGTPEAHPHGEEGWDHQHSEDVEGPQSKRLIPIFLFDLPWEEPLLLDAKHQVSWDGGYQESGGEKHQVRGKREGAR